MKSIGALITGAITAVVGYWIGAVVALLTMHGIPLGSPGGRPTHSDVIAHLFIAAAATAVGVMTTGRIDRYHSRRNALVLGLLLAILAVTGFSKHGSTWPSWFPIAMAFSCLFATLGAIRITHNPMTGL